MNTSNNEAVSNNTSTGKASNQTVIRFLVSAISDNAGNVIFEEAKVGMTFALYSFIIFALVEARGAIANTIRILSGYGFYCEYLYFGLIAVALVYMGRSMYYLLRTIKPREYPVGDAKSISDDQQRLWSLGLNKNKPALEILSITYDDYYKILTAQHEEGFIKCAAYELLRRNLVRATKRANVKKAIRHFFGFVVSIAAVGLTAIVVNIVAMQGSA